MLNYKQMCAKGDPVSYKEYLDKEIYYIKWFQRYHKISIEDACQRWVNQGLAELYSEKYWKSEILNNNGMNA
jgi:hypothetical protein